MTGNSGIMPGQLIITNRGYIPIEKLRVGDSVYTGSGEYRRVKATMTRRVRANVCDIRVNGTFSSVSVTEDVPVMSYRGRKENRGWDKVQYMQAGDLHVGDMAVFPLDREVEGVGLKDLDLAVFLGYYSIIGFADRSKEKVVFHVDSARDVADELEESCQRIFKVPMERYSYSGEDFISVNDPKVFEFCCKFGERNNSKELPMSVLSSGDLFLSAFMRPFFVLNGSRDKTFFLASGSFKLFMGFQRLLLRRGIFSNVYKCDSRDGKFSYYALVINEIEMNKVGKSVPDDMMWYANDGLAYLMVDSIERREYFGVVYALDVDGGGTCCSHLFTVKSE
jgi:hypothetical protein